LHGLQTAVGAIRFIHNQQNRWIKLPVPFSLVAAENISYFTIGGCNPALGIRDEQNGIGLTNCDLGLLTDLSDKLC
jgi:hypothetical protein